METLKDIGLCLACGQTEKETILSNDHLYPLFLLGRGKERKKHLHIPNPFRMVVEPADNCFSLCHQDHLQIDQRKVAAFLPDPGQVYGLGSRQVSWISRGEPLTLVELLMAAYPITDNRRYFPHQIRLMRQVTSRFAAVAAGLNGEFTPELAQKYLLAAQAAREFDRRLSGLTLPARIFTIPVPQVES